MGRSPVEQGAKSMVGSDVDMYHHVARYQIEIKDAASVDNEQYPYVPLIQTEGDGRSHASSALIALLVHAFHRRQPT